MRSVSIDVLRGVAILGILCMNLPFHANLTLGYVPFETELISDKIITFIYSIFADGRFRTLLCILFGAGMVILYESCKNKGVDAVIFLRSRLNWLLLIGFLHAMFIFGGDILMLYALTGILFIKGLSFDVNQQFKRAKKYLWVGGLLNLLLGLVLLAVYNSIPEYYEHLTRGSEEHLRALDDWNSSYWYQAAMQGGIAIALLLFSPFGILWQLLGLMYLGGYLYKSDFFSQGFSQKALIKISVLAVLSTLLSALPQLFYTNLGNEVTPLLSSISAVFVALVYAHIIVKLCQTPNRFITLLIAPGKIAFSLYILQSIVMGIFMRGLYPELALSVTQIDYFIIFVGFTLFQIILANLYFKLFSCGPLEFIWRKLYLFSVKKNTKNQVEAVKSTY